MSNAIFGIMLIFNNQGIVGGHLHYALEYSFLPFYTSSTTVQLNFLVFSVHTLHVLDIVNFSKWTGGIIRFTISYLLTVGRVSSCDWGG